MSASRRRRWRRWPRAQDVRKLSRAPTSRWRSAEGWTGATTVAATMICARLAGIEVFATGGIGGVHRGAEASFDISADLEELAQTPVTVVASGAKAILDLPKTLEVLETRGVPVIAFGQDALPAFWSRDSGPRRRRSASTTPRRSPAPTACARRLGLPGGQLVANPIPAAEAEIPAAAMAPHIAAALAEAEAAGIAAKAVTPFLLARIGERTGGAALAANIALVRSNARLAGAHRGRARAACRPERRRLVPVRRRA